MSAVYSVDVRIEAPVNDTEVTDRVADAVEIASGGRPDSPAGRTRRGGAPMDGFSELLHRREILDTARSVFFDNLEGRRPTRSMARTAKSRSSSTTPTRRPTSRCWSTALTARDRHRTDTEE